MAGVNKKSNADTSKKILKSALKPSKSEDGADKVIKPVKIEKKKSVLFVAAECAPFISTGGLADVMGSLPKTLASLGNYDVRVIIPLYSDISKTYKDSFKYLGNTYTKLSWRSQYCGLFSYEADGVTYYFVDNEYYFKRSGVYGFFDDAERFAFFSKSVFDVMTMLDYYPDIVHCNDWHTALVPIYLKLNYAYKSFSSIRAVFTIHNIEYQGKYGHEVIEDLFGISKNATDVLDYDGCINLMKGAIEVSDKVTTVSPRYAEEIKTPYFSHNLHSCISWNSFKFSGVLNGIDEKLYNPETDDTIFAKYGANDLSGKKKCKEELQRMLNLPVRDDVPIIAVISRLAEHKGIDLIKCVMDEILQENVQFVILGKGDSKYENYFNYMVYNYKNKCVSITAFNRDLSKKIYSGADIFLMPSKMEPCGLSQMIACRYGTVPVVRETGGLADSITRYDAANGKGIGFMFVNYNAHDMLFTLKYALDCYRNKDVWSKIVVNAMQADFSWERSSKEYEKLYNGLLTR